MDVFGGNRIIFLGEIELLRELRNSIAHESGISDDGRADLIRLYTKWT